MVKILKSIDKPLLIATVILFVIGLVMVFSASNVTAYMQYYVSPYHYFVNQALFLVAGVFMFLIMINFPTESYNFISKFLILVIIILLAVLSVVGKAKNQAVSWFDLGPISLQPSEFAKVVSIVFLACYYDKKKKFLDSYKTIFYPIAVCVVIAGLIALQPDLGTAIIYSFIVAVIFFSEPIPKIIKFKILSIALGGFILVGLFLAFSGKSVLLERQQARFNFKRPCDRLLTDGNQVCNGYIAINNGGLWGKGLGNSTQKYLYLPEPYTDFIFTILVEELGALVGLFVIFLYMLILYRILAIGRASNNNRNASMCYGIAVYIFLHIAINLLGIFGLMPLTGVPLPFMSYGGSFTICLIAALTVVQRVSVENGNKKKLSN